MVQPSSLTWFKKEYITKGLALTMLSMGTTLTLEVIPPMNEILACYHLLVSTLCGALCYPLCALEIP